MHSIQSPSTLRSRSVWISPSETNISNQLIVIITIIIKLHPSWWLCLLIAYLALLCIWYASKRRKRYSLAVILLRDTVEVGTKHGIIHRIKSYPPVVGANQTASYIAWVCVRSGNSVCSSKYCRENSNRSTLYIRAVFVRQSHCRVNVDPLRARFSDGNRYNIHIVVVKIWIMWCKRNLIIKRGNFTKCKVWRKQKPNRLIYVKWE